jgi:hypothetical protein
MLWFSSLMFKVLEKCNGAQWNDPFTYAFSCYLNMMHNAKLGLAVDSVVAEK